MAVSLTKDIVRVTAFMNNVPVLNLRTLEETEVANFGDVAFMEYERALEAEGPGAALVNVWYTPHYLEQRLATTPPVDFPGFAPEEPPIAGATEPEPDPDPDPEPDTEPEAGTTT